MKEIRVYNLEFPEGVLSLNICGYTFNAVSNYDDVYKLMPNYSITNITGSHQITAIIKTPDIEKPTILPYENKELTTLYDVLFFVSIFTGRNVFLHNWEGELPITADHRPHTACGGQLRLSLTTKRESVFRVKKTGEIIDTQSTKDIPIWDLEYVSLDFDKDIEDIITHISQEQWKKRYDDGYFLFLYYSMVQWQTIESSFLTAWTIWESLFSIENRMWLSEDDLRNTKAEAKISYVINKYFNIDLDAKSRENIRSLVSARNRLLHFGKTSASIKSSEMKMFIWTTDQIIAIILGLTPNNILNSRENLEKFLKSGSVEMYRSKK